MHGVMHGVMQRVLDPVRRLVHGSAVVVFVATIGTLFGALLVNVVLRYLFGRGITWAYEIPSILFPWSVAASVVIATALNRNIRVHVVRDLLPPSARRFAGLAVYAVVGVVSVGVVWTSVPFVTASRFMRLSETGIPQIYGVSSMLYAFSAIALLCTIDFIALLGGGGDIEPSGAEKSFS